MKSKPDFLESFYTEAMSEMAENFFGRRKLLEQRLAGFASLADRVRDVAGVTLRRFVSFFTLALDENLALAFLSTAQAAMPGLLEHVRRAGPPWPLKPSFGFTLAGRHQNTLEAAYRNLRQGVIDYQEGKYAPSWEDPRRVALSPNYTTLKELARVINLEVEKVNSAQPPSTVLAYAKGLDPLTQEREAVTGGLTGEDIGKIDRDMAFLPVDFEALALPALPEPSPLEAVSQELEALGRTVRAQRSPQEVRQALQAVDFRARPGWAL